MGTTTGALEERDMSGAPFTVGTYVNVRCLVQSITPVAAGGNGGPADLVTLLVETPGNVGQISGVTFVVSPVQCRKAGSTEQA
jgi:hypothetical protein